jgi:hypothetical protein
MTPDAKRPPSPEGEDGPDSKALGGDFGAAISQKSGIAQAADALIANEQDTRDAVYVVTAATLSTSTAKSVLCVTHNSTTDGKYFRSRQASQRAAAIEALEEAADTDCKVTVYYVVGNPHGKGSVSIYTTEAIELEPDDDGGSR